MSKPHAPCAMAVLAVAFVLMTVRLHAAAGGFADYTGTTTGGEGGPTVTVTTLEELTAAIGDDVPRIVQVNGTINLGTSNVRFGSNKTIIGLGASSGFVGNLKGVAETNVIIKNLNFTNPDVVGDGDGLSIETCTHVWVDHCTFVDCGDGSLDIKRGADLITVSWCKFYYTFNSGHNFVNLVGHSDTNGTQDSGKLRITWHHNWWSTLCVERMPRVRFGKMHMYNNYFNAPGNNYCIRAAIESETLAENNYFEDVDEPFNYYGSPAGKIRELNNVFVNVTNLIAANDAVFSPPYTYTMDAAADVKSIVMAGAGTSSGGGGGDTTPPAAPTGLTATAGDGSIALDWANNTEADLASYNVKRSTTSGGSYTTIATGVTASAYTDGTVTNGTTYYYVVSAVDTSSNESANSSEASATPQGGGGDTTPPAAPASLTATAGDGSVALDWADNTEADLASYNVKRSTTSGGSYTTIATGVTASAYTDGTVTNGTTYYYVVSAVDTSSNESANSNEASATPQASGGSTTVTFVSVATHDGRILESSESSNQGGTVDSTGSSSSTLRAGDDNKDRQYKTFLSFDTSSIPDGATITSATVRLRRGGSAGTNPFTTHGNCYVDIKGGNGFSESLTLNQEDFQAGADATQVATLTSAAANGDWSAGSIGSTGLGLINKTGHTQFRIYFALDDNDDGGSDYVGYRSGSDSDPANRPVLEVTYQ